VYKSAVGSEILTWDTQKGGSFLSIKKFAVSRVLKRCMPWLWLETLKSGRRFTVLAATTPPNRGQVYQNATSQNKSHIWTGRDTWIMYLEPPY